MILTRKEKRYPRHVIERIIGTQMRLVPDDGELYANAVRNLYAAFDIAEEYTNRVIVRSVVTFAFDTCDVVLDLPTSPVINVNAVTYYDAEDRLQTLDASSYVLLPSEHWTRIELFDRPALSTRRYSDYRDVVTRTPEDPDGIVLPGNIEAAVTLRAGTLCEADGDAIIGRSVSALPVTVERLLNPYRITPYGRG